ncbi:MAG: hypothetical protein HKN45_01060, partial [Flavobacteriales bacterium]|nr:hypothetical protein [Flavobacteriales bacterium]
MKDFFEFMIKAPGLSATSAYVSILIAMVAGIVFRVWTDRPSAILLLYCVLAFSLALVEIYVVWFARMQTTVIHNLWGLMSLLLMSIYFYYLLRRHQRLVLTISVILIISTVGFTLIWSSWNDYASVARVIENAGLILLTLLGFYQLFVVEESQDPLGSPELWILSGMLIYLTGSLFSFLLSDWILSEDQNAIMGMWYV